MISLCVFSKNRPMQLCAFLESLKSNTTNITDVRVLYLATNQDFEYGYSILQKDYPDVKFIPETRITDQVLELVSSFHEYFLWATDDSLFIKPCDISKDKLDWIFKDKKALALNLRMGLNIRWQNHWHSDTSDPINVLDKYKDIVLWDAEQYNVNTDVGRVWQNDASIMPRDMYLERLHIESDWKQHVGCRGLDNVGGCGRVFSPCLVTAFEHSIYLNLPLNLVHYLDDGRLYADNWGRFVQYSTDLLNTLFLMGQRIDWQKIDTGLIDCGRMEPQLTFYAKGN